MKSCYIIVHCSNNTALFFILQLFGKNVFVIYQFFTDIQAKICILQVQPLPFGSNFRDNKLIQSNSKKLLNQVKTSVSGLCSNTIHIVIVNRIILVLYLKTGTE